MGSVQFLTLAFLVSLPVRASTTYIDLSYDIHEGTMYWPTNKPYSRTTHHKGFTEGGMWYESYEFCMAEHTGTHLDAPSHFAEGKWSVEQIPLEHLIGPGVVVDIKDKVAKDPLYQLTTNDMMDWLKDHGPLPDKAIVLINTGWAARYGNKTAYFGTSSNDTSKLIFPGMSVGAAQILTSYERVSGRKVVGVGLDTPSIDYGPTKLFPTHVELASHNVFILENLGDMSALPAKGFELIVMPIKLRGGSGGPARIIAKIPDESNAPDGASLLLAPTSLIMLLLLMLWL